MQTHDHDFIYTVHIYILLSQTNIGAQLILHCFHRAFLLYNFRYQQMHFYVYNSFHNTAIPDMFRRLPRHHHQGLYQGLHIKSIRFVAGLNNISRTHYQENGCTCRV
jgi:hypothetical protein